MYDYVNQQWAYNNKIDSYTTYNMIYEQLITKIENSVTDILY